MKKALITGITGVTGQHGVMGWKAKTGMREGLRVAYVDFMAMTGA